MPSIFEKKIDTTKNETNVMIMIETIKRLLKNITIDIQCEKRFKRERGIQQIAKI